MQLVIDIGNTQVKAAIFDGKEMKDSFVFTSVDNLLLSGIIKNNPVNTCILASVVDNIEPFIAHLKEKLNVLIFNSATLIPIKNLYKTVQSLGSDRLAAAVGGNALYPDKNVLVIDCGTCIKYDFVNSKNEYLGGAISPGLNMRFNAMHTFTARLPLLTLDQSYDALIGTSTNESMLSGAQNGAIAEIEGFIEQYKQQFPDVFVVLTGGDVNFFEKRLKNSIFADPNLIQKGLKEILDYNLNRIK
ncbi:MAG: type III pantothenate kinase [Bacteroidetes bacterium]|nr:type III pantothenate kinase [Bacteroidota bacterium]